jgi:hypothetical protein
MSDSKVNMMRLISFHVNNGDSSRKADEKKQSLYIEQIKNLDNRELHNSYIYAAFSCWF